jgi:hypothetical protein
MNELHGVKAEQKITNQKCSEIARIWMLFAGSPWPLVAGKSPSTISLKLLVLVLEGVP